MMEAIGGVASLRRRRVSENPADAIDTTKMEDPPGLVSGDGGTAAWNSTRAHGPTRRLAAVPIGLIG